MVMLPVMGRLQVIAPPDEDQVGVVPVPVIVIVLPTPANPPVDVILTLPATVILLVAIVKSLATALTKLPSRVIAEVKVRAPELE